MGAMELSMCFPIEATTGTLGGRFTFSTARFWTLTDSAERFGSGGGEKAMKTEETSIRSPGTDCSDSFLVLVGSQVEHECFTEDAAFELARQIIDQRNKDGWHTKEVEDEPIRICRVVDFVC